MGQFEGDVVLGKLSPDALRRNVLRYTGAPRKDLIVGGGLGEDAALIRWPDTERFLVVASDPIVGASEGAGELLVHVHANDVVCKGGEPSWLIVTLIIPAGEGVAMVSRIMQEVHEACAAMGIAVVGGHTELSDRYDWPVIVGTMMGPTNCQLGISRIRPGDRLLVTGHAGLEGMSILAHDRPDLLSCLSAEELTTIRAWRKDLSVVPPARVLRDFSHYMHDPTEGGLEGALLEVCKAAGLPLSLERDAVPISSITRKAAASLGFDPMRLISSGMLIAAVPEERVEAAQAALLQNRIPSSVIGQFGEAKGDAAEERLDMHEELWDLLARGRA